jgi:hypothetical protein
MRRKPFEKNSLAWPRVGLVVRMKNAWRTVSPPPLAR